MAATMLGSLLVSLGLESGEFRSGLSAAEKELKASVRRIEAAGAKVANFGRNLTLGVTLPLTAMGVATFKAASDFEELQSAFDVTFGAMAGSVRQWAEETGNALGRSTQEIQESTVAFQQLFSKAFDPAKATEMSKQFAVLTQDLASFKNLSNEVAQQKLFSGLVGESEPLRAVGVLLSENAVKAKAMELGLAGAKGEMSEQAKVSARAAIIMEQLSAAQGDVVRTSGSAANQLKSARAALDEMSVAIGTKLLPALTPLIGAITNVLTAFNELPSSVQTGIVAIAGLAAALGPIVSTLGFVITGLRTFSVSATAAAAAATASGTAMTGFAAGVGLLRARLIVLIATFGPYAAALAAVGGLIYFVTTRTVEAAKATGAYAKTLAEAQAASSRAADIADKLATAHGRVRAEALAAAKAERENIKQKLASARASVILAAAEAARTRSQAIAAAPLAGGGPGEGVRGRVSPGQGKFNDARKAAMQADANAKAAESAVIGLISSLNTINKAIDAGIPDVAKVAPASSGGGGSDRSGGAGGPSAAEIAQRFNDELANYDQQALSARQGMALSASERADLELRSLELARVRTREGIKAEKDYDGEQKKRLLAAVENAAEEERASINFKLQMETEREIADMAQVRFDTARDLLANDYDMAETQAERKRLALQILALEHEYRRNQLEMVINSKTAGDAEKARAAAILASLGEIQAGERASVSRGNETSVERYMREINKTPAQINEAIDEIKIRGLEDLNDQLVDAMLNFKSLGDVAKNVIKSIIAEFLRLQIQKSIIGPLSNLLGFGASLGGGGSLPGTAGGMDLRGFGGPRAKGGGVSAGKMYLTSEDGPEIFQAGRSGRIISNKDLRELNGSGGGIAQIVPSPYFDVVVDGRVMRAAPGIASAGASGGLAQMRRSGQRRVA